MIAKYLFLLFVLLLLCIKHVSAYDLSSTAKAIHDRLFPTPLKIHQMLYGYDAHNESNNMHPIYRAHSAKTIKSPSIHGDKDKKYYHPTSSIAASQFNLENNNPHHYMRSLADPDVCPKCSNLTICRSLNNKMVQEKYDPNHIKTKITCSVLEDLGARLSVEIFGNGKSFRDTVQCRDIVMQYLCSFWGSENSMYTNSCLYKEDTNNAIEELKRFAPRPPCRSFCVQVSLVCANNKEFGQLCANIACPPEEEECTPDPTVDEQKLNMGLGCELPFDLNPYVRIRGSSTNFKNFSRYYLVSISIAVFSSIFLLI
jgi:hypothetical protein